MHRVSLITKFAEISFVLLLSIQVSAASDTKSEIVSRLVALMAKASAVESSFGPNYYAILFDNNPGKKAAIRIARGKYQQCESAALIRPYSLVFGHVYDIIGQRKFLLMREFYSRPDLARLHAIKERRSEGLALSAREKALMAQLEARYPLAEFSDAGRLVMRRFSSGYFGAEEKPDFAPLVRCREEQEKTFDELEIQRPMQVKT